jgi:Tol biopolymer transport system component
MKDVKSTSAPVQVMEAFVNGPTQALDHSPFGPLLLYFGFLEGRTSMDIVIYPLTEKRPKVIASTNTADVEPQVSPDGKWLAYASSESGSRELWIEPFPPNGTPKLRLSRAGGRQPMWRADSRELFFVSDDRKFYAVRIPESGPSPDIEPEFLFTMQANVSNTRNSYVPSPEGQRFLVNMVLDNEDAPINVISNWTAGIK